MNNKYGVSFEKDLKNRLKDKKFAKAWKESEPEYNLACQLIDLRLKEKMSQRDLAKKINTSQVAISRIETMTGNPSLKLLKRLSLALNSNLNISFNGGRHKMGPTENDCIGWQILSDSKNPTDYLKKMRKRDQELGSYLGTNCPQIEMITNTGKKIISPSNFNSPKQLKYY